MNNLIGISGKAGSGKDLVYTIIKDLFPEMNWGRIRFSDKLKDMVCLLLNCTREQLEDREFKEKELGKEWVKYELSYISHSRLSYGDCPEYYEKYFCSKEEAIEYIKGDLEVDQSSIEISEIGLTPRLLLQLLGTECGRKIIHPNIWVSATFAEYKPQHFRTVKYQGSFVDHLTTMPNWIITDVRFPNEAKAVKDRGGILIRINRPGFENTGDHLSEIALDDYKNFDTIIINDGTIEDLSKKIKEFLL